MERNNMHFLGVCLLLALGSTARGDDVSRCSQGGVTELRDTLRQSACRLGANRTEGDVFRARVRAKHGVDQAVAYFSLADLFRLTATKVWCRTTCADPTPENVTWCVNIAYLDRDVETCITTDATQEVTTNSSCEAEAVGLPSYLSLPSDCSFAGRVGCLGLTNLDWFFKSAYMTCTVHTDTCYQKSFTELGTKSGVAQPPEFDVFPTSPRVVLQSDRLVLHTEISSTVDRNILFWQHNGKMYKKFIFEDPYCDHNIEECHNDSHPDAISLRLQRVRVYRFTRVINLNGCQQSSLLYRLESYLIVDSAGEEDSGEYTLNITTTHSGSSPISVVRSVNASVICQPPSDEFTCSVASLSVAEGTNSEWNCQIKAWPSTNFSLVLNKTAVLLPKPGDEECGKEPLVIFSVQEDPQHVCFSSYHVSVAICSANESVVGVFQILSSSGRGTTVVVKLTQEPSVASSESSSSSPNNTVFYYAVPLSALFGSLVVLAAILLLLLRNRKRRRDRRVITRMHSPILKEVSLCRKESELGLPSPVSPHSWNASLSDPLEFPRNRLYIYTNKVLGEGSFGRVLQAKAEGIVPGMPDRNMVAIKTTKENATSVEQEELLAELELMRTMEPHENILNLLGQCTTAGGPVCLIVEFATYGNLRDFLRQCEEVVLSLNHLPHIPRNRSRARTFSASSSGSTQPLIQRQDSVFTPGSGQTHFVFPSPTSHANNGSCSSSNGEGKLMAQHPDTAAVPLAHSVTPIGHDYINTKGLVYMEDVHNFALQIVCGLQHLASMQIVHCDLAARNVLIAEGFVLKIADFGLARDISGREMYKKNPRGKIPVKWTAPEALEKRVFTIKSDVWSYGVLLWELFTYGHTPYPEVNLGPSYEPFISYLKAGNRMSQPESCPASFYELMLECWHLDPSLRPAPHDIVSQLTPTDSLFDDVDSELNNGLVATKISVTNGAVGHQSCECPTHSQH